MGSRRNVHALIKGDSFIFVRSCLFSFVHSGLDVQRHRVRESGHFGAHCAALREYVVLGDTAWRVMISLRSSEQTLELGLMLL